MCCLIFFSFFFLSDELKIKIAIILNNATVLSCQFNGCLCPARPLCFLVCVCVCIFLLDRFIVCVVLIRLHLTVCLSSWVSQSLSLFLSLSPPFPPFCLCWFQRKVAALKCSVSIGKPLASFLGYSPWHRPLKKAPFIERLGRCRQDWQEVGCVSVCFCTRKREREKCRIRDTDRWICEMSFPK